MRVLVACEFSGRVREAFRKLGHDAWSCDILPADDNSPYHIQDDVLNHLTDGWDLMIAHPPCTHLAVSGAAWFKQKREDGRQQEAIDFFMKFVNAPIPKIAVENPVCIMASVYKKPTQYIQPYEFGDPETKKTSLWLKNLPPLVPTNIVEPQFIIGKDGKKYSPTHYYWQKKDRGKARSVTFQGIADAMAQQWGGQL